MKYYGNALKRYNKLVNRYQQEYEWLTEEQVKKLADAVCQKKKVYGLRRSLGVYKNV